MAHQVENDPQHRSTDHGNEDGGFHQVCQEQAQRAAVEPEILINAECPPEIEGDVDQTQAERGSSDDRKIGADAVAPASLDGVAQRQQASTPGKGHENRSVADDLSQGQLLLGHRVIGGAAVAFQGDDGFERRRHPVRTQAHMPDLAQRQKQPEGKIGSRQSGKQQLDGRQVSISRHWNADLAPRRDMRQ